LVIYAPSSLSFEGVFIASTIPQENHTAIEHANDIQAAVGRRIDELKLK